MAVTPAIKRLNFLINISIRGLPKTTTEASLEALFSTYGKVRSLKLVKDLFSGDCKGFATIAMEGHEARAAIAALDGSDLNGKQIYVMQERPMKGRGRQRR